MLFDRLMPGHLRRAYFYDSAAVALWGIGIGAAVNYFQYVARKYLGATDLQLGVLSGLSFLGLALGVVWNGLAGGRRRMHMLVASQTVSRIVLILAGLATTAWVYVACVAVFWIFELAPDPAYFSLVRDVYPHEHRPRAFSWARVEANIFSAIATLASGLLMERAGVPFRVMFAASGLLGLVATHRFFVHLGEWESEEGRFLAARGSLRGHWRAAFSDAGFRHFLVGFMIWGGSNLMCTPLYTIFLVDRLGLNPEQFGRLDATRLVAMLFSLLVFAHIVPRLGWRRSSAVTGVLASVLPALLAFVGTLPAAYLGFAFMGLQFGSGQVVRVSFLTSRGGPELVPTLRGIDNLLAGLRGVVAPLLGVSVAKPLLGLEGALALGAVGALTGAAYLAFVARDS